MIDHLHQDSSRILRMVIDFYPVDHTIHLIMNLMLDML